MKELFAAVAVLTLIPAGVFGLAELGLRMSQRYAPLHEQVRRETFEQSRAFREGTVRDLENLMLDWSRGDAAQRAAIGSVARHRLADVPDDILTPPLRAWSRDLETAR